MTQSQSSWLTSGLICAAAASVIAGIAMREKVDVGAVQPAASKMVGSGLLASRTTDTDIPEAKYFTELATLLRQKYVEPIADDLKLASGAVRGMVASLGDPDSLYFTPDMAKVYKDAVAGSYSGIGADLVLVRVGRDRAFPSAMAVPEGEEDPLTAARLPRVVVAGVVPGGPADKAGVKPGDWVESIDGHWVFSAEQIDELRKTQQKVQSKEWPSSKLHDLSVKLRSKVNGALLPYKAFERLLAGRGETAKVVWNRPGVGQVPTTIVRGSCKAPLVARTDSGAFRVRLAPGVGEALKKASAGAAEVTLDLRSRSFGDLNAMSEALGALGPTGNCGRFAREGGKEPIPLRVAGGSEPPPKLQVLVDAQTGGLYQAFAQALAFRAGAKVIGPVQRRPKVARFADLPDGAGYSLVIGFYEPLGGKP